MFIEDLIGKTVEDEYLGEHVIKSVISEGGQGVVCSTKDNSIVLKFCFGNAKALISKEENQDLYKQKTNEIKAVYLNPFPENLHLAYPVAILKNYAGYVMRLLDGMENCNALAEMNTYPQTGSYRRRFELFSRAACVLSQIHSNGMVYCDISPSNMFVTKNAQGKNQNMWFIDSDNVYILSDKNKRYVYTPRYAAPEIINQKSPCTQYSDVYSFAVVTFEALACNHPFEGNKISGGWDVESCAWDATITKTVPHKVQTKSGVDPLYGGNIPWIEDLQDTSNHTTNGLPRQFFLNDELSKLYNKTFDENGRKNPQKRPTIYFWAKAFAKASDTTVSCSDPTCSMSHIFNKQTDLVSNKCPFCDKELGKILIIKSQDSVVFTREIEEGQVVEVPERVFVPFDMIKNPLPLLSIKLENNFLMLKKSQTSTADKTSIFCDGKEIYNKLFDSSAACEITINARTFTIEIGGAK